MVSFHDFIIEFEFSRCLNYNILMLGLSIFCSERSDAKAEMLTFSEPYP